MKQTRSFWQLKRFWALAVLIVLLGICLAAWIYRTALAETAIKRWCEDRRLTCALTVETLEFDTVVAADVSLSEIGKEAQVTAKALRADIEWIDWRTPTVKRISIETPRAAFGYDGETVDLGPLVRFRRDGSPQPSSAPAFEIIGGLLSVETPAGLIEGTVEAAGQWPKQGRFTAQIDPAELSQNGQSLSLTEGKVTVDFKDAQIEGRADLILDRAAFDTVQAEDIAFTAETQAEVEGQIDWSLAIGTLSHSESGLETRNSRAEGVLQFSPTDGATGFERLTRLTAKAETGPSRYRDLAAKGSTFSISLVPSDGEIRFEKATFQLKELTHPFGRLAKLSGHLSGSHSAVNGWELDATTAVRALQLSKGLRDQWLSPLKCQNSLAAHCTALKEAVAGALTDLSFETPVSIVTNPGVQDPWQVTALDDLTVSGRNGLELSLVSTGALPVFALTQDGMELSGITSVSGAGLPKMTADVRRLRVSGPTLTVEAGGVKVPDWREGDTAISADLNALTYRAAGARLALTALGEIGVSGDLLGVDLGPTTLFGEVEARRGPEGWRVQTLEQKCLGLKLQSARASGLLTVGETNLSLCPEDGRFIRQTEGVPGGRISLGDVSIPFSGNQSQGRLELRGAIVDWSYDGFLDLKAAANDLALPLALGNRSLDLQANGGDVNIKIAEKTRISATLGNGVLSGQLVPARVRLGTAIFEGELASRRFTGAAQTSNVRISDLRDDPIYQPLLADFNASFDGAAMALSGPVRLAKSGVVVAETQLDLNLLTLTGAAAVTSPILEFRPKGLQPKDLSDRARGFLSNARGRVQGRADFTIIAGTLSGTGEIVADALGFDTFRLGAVEGVNGTLVFSDVIALVTPPGQTVRIDRLNPGVPLQDGVLTFQVLPGLVANLENAVWPFAGGELQLDPTRWTISGTRDTLRVNANRIDLAQLIETFTLPDLEAEGTVTGTFPIAFENGNAFIRGARLVADETGGVIRYTGKALAQTGADDPAVGSAFQALRDFRFKVLEIGIDGNLIDDIVISAVLLGRNPDVLGGADFNFNISIDSKLAQLIRSGQRAASSSWITEAIANQTEQTPNEP
ncbi:MAG: YdbH domain-containing protein [Pseudomonadota bacterium]